MAVLAAYVAGTLGADILFLVSWAFSIAAAGMTFYDGDAFPAWRGNLFAAASESVALLNLGFRSESVKSLGTGEAISIDADGRFEIRRFAASPRRAHCFFEWIYFANVASTLDDRSVYLSRAALARYAALPTWAESAEQTRRFLSTMIR